MRKEKKVRNKVDLMYCVWYKRKIKEIKKKDVLIIFKSTKIPLIQKKLSYPI